jgi:hypothetical protein
VQGELERIIINHCSPVILGVKPAALFTLPSESCLAPLAGVLPAAVSLMALRKNGGQVLVFDQRLLEKTISDERVRALLEGMGYPRRRRGFEGAAPGGRRKRGEDSPVFVYLDYFKSRFQSLCPFPHEIGLFLGYPVDDVLGFVKYRGRRYKLRGFWKVYGDVEQAKNDFCRYELCREAVRARLQKGGLGALKDTARRHYDGVKSSAAPARFSG